MADFNTKNYWEARYQAGGNSGAGSYGRLALFKAEVLGDFAQKHGVTSVAELGCGDGSQLGLFPFAQYYGLDITETAIKICQDKYKDDSTKTFSVYHPDTWEFTPKPEAEMAISLDVVYHLLEDHLWEQYLRHLFGLGTRFVALYCNNTDSQGPIATHLRYRKFTTWVRQNLPEWQLAGYQANRFPFDPQNPDHTSISDFYFYSRGEDIHESYAIHRPQTGGLALSTDEISELMSEARSKFEIGQPEAMRSILEKVASSPEAPANALNNLAMVYRREGNNLACEQLLKRILAEDNTFIPARASLGLLYLRDENWLAAQPFLGDSLTLQDSVPDITTLISKAMAETGAKPLVIKPKTQGRKQYMSILCFPNFDSFIEPISLALDTRVKLTTTVSSDNKTLVEAARNSEIVWLEWGNQMAGFITHKHPDVLAGKRVFCRIHSYELLTGLSQGIDYTHVTDLVFVCNEMKRIFQQLHPTVAPGKRLHVIPNAIDLKRFTLAAREDDFRIGFLGTIDFKKDPMLLLQAFAFLHSRDQRFKLSIGGGHNDMRYQIAMKHFIETNNLEKAVSFDGVITDVPRWLENKNFIICTSPIESHGVGLCEALATGCRPLITHFAAADELYPQDFLWRNFDELAELALLPARRTAEEYRQFVAENYSQALFNQRINQAMFDEVEVGFQVVDNCAKAPSAW